VRAQGFKGFVIIALATTTAACASRYRKQVMGTGKIGAPVPITGVGDAHQIEMQVYLPRAMRVRYQIHCPGQTLTGAFGETWEQYEQRRLAELRRERERNKKMVGSVTGALLGRAGASATTKTPAGDARVDAEADGSAVGEAAADAAMAPVQLAPSDTGARTWKRKLSFVARASGSCRLALEPAEGNASLGGAIGQLTVTRMVDRRAEERRFRVAASTRATEVRGKLHASLVARGADPQKRARERAAARAAAAAEARAARARYEAETRARRDASARARLKVWAERQEARKRAARRISLRVSIANANREWVKRWLRECGGDPDKRDRERRAEAERRRRLAEAERRRRQAEARAALLVRVRRRHHLRLKVGMAYANREWVKRWLGECGADPHKRKRERRAEADRRMHERRAEAERRRLRAQADRRENERRMREWEDTLRKRREARARHERIAHARLTAALGARAAIKVTLQDLGAVDRPPRPAPPRVVRPPRPQAGAAWVSGHYEWRGGAWVWLHGHWAAPPAGGVEWVAPVEVIIRGVRVLRPGRWRKRSKPRPRTRDHRTQSDDS
jgi:hypothetical protein